LMIAKKNGKVSWKDIAEDAKFLDNVNFVGADGFNSGSNLTRAKMAGKTFYDYLRNLWNDTKSQKGIYLMYEKVLYPIGKDEDGNLIYEYRGKEL